MQSMNSGPVVSLAFIDQFKGMWCVAHEKGVFNVWKGIYTNKLLL